VPEHREKIEPASAPLFCGGHRSEEGQHAPLELDRNFPESTCMARAGDHPKLLRTGGGLKDELRMAARDVAVVSPADEQDGEWTCRDSLLRGNVASLESAFCLDHPHSDNRGGPEDGFPQPGAETQPGVIIRNLAQVPEGTFRHYASDARLDGSRLQRNRRAHGFAECEKPPRLLAGTKRVHDGTRVVPLLPSVGRHRAVARAVCA
jgi:hypothetical protein